MHSEICGDTMIVSDAEGKVIFSLTKAELGTYHLNAPQGQALRIYGIVVDGGMFYQPGIPIEISTSDAISLEILRPRDILGPRVTVIPQRK